MGSKLDVLREACDQELARKRPVWRPDIRLAPLGILLLGLAVAHTAQILPRRCNLWRRSRPVFRTLGNLRRKSRQVFRILGALCRHGSYLGWYSRDMNMIDDHGSRNSPFNSEYLYFVSLRSLFYLLQRVCGRR